MKTTTLLISVCFLTVMSSKAQHNLCEGVLAGKYNHLELIADEYFNAEMEIHLSKGNSETGRRESGGSTSVLGKIPIGKTILGISAEDSEFNNWHKSLENYYQFDKEILNQSDVRRYLKSKVVSQVTTDAWSKCMQDVYGHNPFKVDLISQSSRGVGDRVSIGVRYVSASAPGQTSATVKNISVEGFKVRKEDSNIKNDIVMKIGGETFRIELERISKKTSWIVIDFKETKSIVLSFPPILSLPKLPETIVARDRDGNKYNTVKIGSQTWFAENLRVDINGDKKNPNNPIHHYGKLYSWEQAKDACPDGWHLPQDAEWKTLVREVGGDVARKLKSTSHWGQGENGNNSSGLNIFPTGVYDHSSNTFGGFGDAADFWTATSTSSTDAVAWVVYGDAKGLQRKEKHLKENGRSVRCVRD